MVGFYSYTRRFGCFAQTVGATLLYTSAPSCLASLNLYFGCSSPLLDEGFRCLGYFEEPELSLEYFLKQILIKHIPMTYRAATPNIQPKVIPTTAPSLIYPISLVQGRLNTVNPLSFINDIFKLCYFISNQISICQWFILQILEIYNFLKIEILYQKMRIQSKENKENSFSTKNSFTTLLKNMDVNLGNGELNQLKILKQEHAYVQKLKQQRIKIEQLKQKHDNLQRQLKQLTENNIYLQQFCKQKDENILNLEQQLSIEIGNRQMLEKLTQKQAEADKGRSKTRLKQLEIQNSELKKTLAQKQLIIISLEEEHDQKMKKIKEDYTAQKKSLLNDLSVKEAKQKSVDKQITQINIFIQRQAKLLKSQNLTIQEQREKNDALMSQIEELKELIAKKDEENEANKDQIRQLCEELEELHIKFQNQMQNNKKKSQLEQVRRKITNMHNEQLQRIQFIVNELQQE